MLKLVKLNKFVKSSRKTLPALVKDTLKEYQSNQILMQESFAEIMKKEEKMQQQTSYQQRITGASTSSNSSNVNLLNSSQKELKKLIKNNYIGKAKLSNSKIKSVHPVAKPSEVLIISRLHPKTKDEILNYTKNQFPVASRFDIIKLTRNSPVEHI